MSKPFAQSAENNKVAILEAITPYLVRAERVLELGAGTGQHAVHFAAALPHLIWQASDLSAALPDLAAWIEPARLINLPAAIELDASALPWPRIDADAIYAANILHFMPLAALDAVFAGAATTLATGNYLLIYGPFHIAGQPVSPGNAALDAWLVSRDPAFGIRALEVVLAVATRNGFRLCRDHLLPANNHLLAWCREGAGTVLS